MKTKITVSLVGLLLLFTAVSIAQTVAPLSALARMPVKEVTVFKDGHVFVLHEGSVPTDESGNVLMDYLPAPVLGTFWPYSADKNVKLHSVTANQRPVLVEQTALNLVELLDTNAGAEVVITEKPAGDKEPVKHVGTIIGIPVRTSEELRTTGLPNSIERLPIKGSIILLKTSDGVRAVAIENIRDVTFRSSHKTKISNEEFRNLLTLKLDWGSRRPEKSANVGLVYLQKGMRWIPNYRIALDGNGSATVKLQATLINELIDLENTTANLVIGVPTFTFKDTLDPMALQVEANRLSQYFDSNRAGLVNSNFVAVQTARMSEQRSQPSEPTPASLGPDLPESGKSEDLFIFTLRNLTLKKGERMVVPVAEFTIPYQDVYTLDLPFAPPPEFRSSFDSQQQAEMARLLSAPKVSHKFRLTNKSNYPLTTAPALIVRGDRVLAQGMMTYTAAGASTDLEITNAIDVQISKSETEIRRTPNAVRWQGYDYARVDLSGTISLTNFRNQSVALEITRHALGNIDTADNNGTISKVNVLEDGDYMPTGGYPSWWRSSNWPSWWNHLNGIGRINWKFNLEPGKKIELKYTWHYFWR
jgi:hypothetical protein